MRLKDTRDIERELLEGFEIPSGELQEEAVLRAINDIGDIENETGTFSSFMIEIRDFLLDYMDKNKYNKTNGSNEKI